MDTDRNRILVESIRRLLRRGAGLHLRKIVGKTHAADLTPAFNSLPLRDQRKLLDVIDDIEKKGDKQSKILLTNKLNEIVNDDDGTFQRKNSI